MKTLMNETEEYMTLTMNEPAEYVIKVLHEFLENFINMFGLRQKAI